MFSFVIRKLSKISCLRFIIIFFQSTHAHDNIYSWDESANSISTDTIGMEFLNCSGHNVRVENLSIPINLTIPSHHSSVIAKPDEFQTDNEKLTMHSIKIDHNESAIHVEILPVNCSGRKLKVFMKKNAPPTLEEYDYNWTLPVTVLTENENGSRLVQSGKFFLSNVQLNHNSVGKYYLGVIANAHDNTSAECPQVNYTLLSFTSSCLYWNEMKQRWMGDGCEVCQNAFIESDFYHLINKTDGSKNLVNSRFFPFLPAVATGVVKWKQLWY